MPGPVKNFTAPTGLSILISAPVPFKVAKVVSIYSMPYLRRWVFTFYKFGLTIAGCAKPVLISKPQAIRNGFPRPPMMRLMMVTFPPIYKTRTGRARPLKGQLWPRTR